jgi:arylsulfatase A-like enzyme
MLLQKAGYTTGAMGKWGLGPVGSTGDPSKKGVEHFFGYNCQAVAHSYFPPYLWRNAEKVTINKKPISGHPKAVEGDVKLSDYQGEQYAPKLMIEEAEAFIGKNSKKPFFLYLPFVEPHVAMQPPEESVNKFPKEWDDTQYRGGNGYTPHPRPRAAYAAMISDLDSYVGRVLKALEKAGVQDDTLVIFSSDNGTTMPSGTEKQFNVGGVDAKFFNSTAGLRGFKGTVYEGGIRVPMIVKFPGVIKPGTTNDSPCYFADWFPTIMEATGHKQPDGLDGESLWPTLTTVKPFIRKKPLIYVFPETQGQVAVIDGDRKFVRTKLKTKTPGPWEVYNLATDPGEKTDLAKSSQAEIEKIEALLNKEVAENANFPVPIPGVTPSAK